MDGHEAQTKKGFWGSLPGILTGIAGVLTAVGTIVGIMVVQGGGGTPVRSDPNVPAVVLHDTSNTSNTSGPTRTQWAKAANDVCAGIDAQLSGYGQPSTFEEQIAAYGIYAQAMRDADRQVRAIATPTADADRIREMTDLWDQAAGHLESAVTAAQAGEAQSYQNELLQYSDPNSRGNQIAYDLGASACADMGSGMFG